MTSVGHETDYLLLLHRSIKTKLYNLKLVGQVHVMLNGCTYSPPIVGYAGPDFGYRSIGNGWEHLVDDLLACEMTGIPTVCTVEAFRSMLQGDSTLDPVQMADWCRPGYAPPADRGMPVVNAT